MPFKIVQTIEDNQICLSVVPSNWEENGLLYWPNKNKFLINKLLNDENSLPAKDKWEKIMCVAKRECATRKEAQDELSRMECQSDTEEKEESSAKRTRVECKSFEPIDLNYLLHDTSLQSVSTLREPGASHNSPSEYVQKEVRKVDVDQPLIIIQDHQIIHQQSNLPVTNEENLIVDTQREENCENVLSQILQNQTIMIDQQAKLQTSLDTLINLLNKHMSVAENKGSSKTDEFVLCPINSQQKLEEFEEFLKDETKFKKIVDQMSIICGKSGKENGMDVCYKVIDYFLDRNFVSFCSWTGNTREAGGATKTALKYFKNFKNCILQTVLLADNQFSEQKLEIFLKRIIKNSNQRKVAKKILSTHKNRPNKLNYKKNKTKAADTESNSDEEKIANKENDNVEVNELADTEESD